MSSYVSPIMYPAKLKQELHGGPQTPIETVEDAVQYIAQFKLTRVAQFFPHAVNSVVQTGVQLYAQNWIKPSGPRRPGEGVEDCEQGIINVGLYESGVTMTFTQLLAGFLIGPNGTSIRDLMRRTGCHVKSFTENVQIGRNLRTRVFILQADEPQSILLCMDVILAAVDRYKELAEGQYQGKYVNRIQKIKGFVFYYYPPPKNIVPNAAGINGLPPSKQAKLAKFYLGFQSTGGYLAYLDSICHQIARPNSDQGLTQFIREALEMPSEDVDDIACIHPGLYPGKIYEDNLTPTLPGNVANLQSRAATGFARAAHLCQTLKAAAAGQVGGEEAKEEQEGLYGTGASSGEVSAKVMQLVEGLIREKPEIVQFFPGEDLLSMKTSLAQLIMENLGLGGNVTHNTTGVFLKSRQSSDPVVEAPDMGRRSSSLSTGLRDDVCNKSSSSMASVSTSSMNVYPTQDVQVAGPSYISGADSSPLPAVAAAIAPSFRRTPFSGKWRQSSVSFEEQRALPTVVGEHGPCDSYNPFNQGLEGVCWEEIQRMVATFESTGGIQSAPSRQLSSGLNSFFDFPHPETPNSKDH
eukprot:TRINITY_DN10092_c0_g1_i3.p1 TRINITY_DN10092_c0_g1~~TRINITY_DN10092_c0_g1_i3.p1  ORF type:complete len:652 (-),score=68.92 TRINITY_DN10092_c0_g1_i3:265-2001(-)